MKIKILLSTVLLFSTLVNLKAQNILKIGHVNIQELAQKHPSMDSIRAVVEQETKDMEEVYADMIAEHESKLKAFEEESTGYSDFVKTAKQNELIELAQKIQSFRASAEQQLQQRNMELIRPVYENINQEISNIAGYNKFTYILDVSTGSVAYISPESENITPLVLERLQKK
ncbi:OmpH family outer membrane protein [Prolixibacteraceae bacterium Z1-6]|uniref:OmpH family outer membrane protein n=1 Tax=Draconibacterium aestuarii TaxID=2998507 RepID=A0A9X3J4T1_9BACT|nr:OmpH family outer membrane protein [Prolixibacteraceae bacterium Z1-6]